MKYSRYLNDTIGLQQQNQSIFKECVCVIHLSAVIQYMEIIELNRIRAITFIICAQFKKLLVYMVRLRNIFAHSIEWNYFDRQIFVCTQNGDRLSKIICGA